MPAPPPAVQYGAAGADDLGKGENGGGSSSSFGGASRQGAASEQGLKAAADMSQDASGGVGGGHGYGRRIPPGGQQAHSPEQHLYDTRALLKLIWLLHGPALRRALLLIYGYQTFVFFQPVLLNELTNQLTHGQKGDNRIWILPALLFLSPLLGSLCKAQAQLTMIRIQIGLRSQLTAAVYRKCLRLSAGARASMPSGRVVNLMSADVAKICDFLYPQLTFISAAPLAVVVSLTMLWFQIGWATLVGLAVLLLSTPVSNLARHRNEMLKASDSRMKLVGQFLVGVRVIKMYHWEQPQAESITDCRADELRALRNMIPSKVAMQTLLYVLPQLAGVLSFLTVGLTNPQALTAARAFSSLVLFQIMRFPLLTLSTGLVELGAAIISARRITAFMAAEEQRDYVTRITQPPGTTPPPPPNARRRSFSVYDSGGVAAAPAEAAQLDPDGARRRHSHTGGGPLTAFPAGPSATGGGVGIRGSTRDCKGGGDAAAIAAAATAATAVVGSTGGLLQSSPATPRSSRPGLMTTSLAGVEPGLTIRAAGFRWAAEAAQQHQKEQEEQRRREGGVTAEGKGPGGSGDSGVKGWRRLSFRSRSRGRGEQRPFMEVVDAAAESLASGTAALGAKLSRALTTSRQQRRDVDGRVSYMSSSGGGGDSATTVNDPAGHTGGHGREDVDEERVELLRGGDIAMSGDIRTKRSARREEAAYGPKPAGGGGRDPSSVVVVFDSASDGSGCGAGEGGGGSGGSSGGKGPGGSAAGLIACSGGGGGGGGGGGKLKRSASSSSSSSSASSSFAASGAFELGQIDLRVRPGELVCVVGRVGSGKSSLLSAALGEMELSEELAAERGDVVGLGGRVAYVAQQAWIVNATLAENVTMGKPLDEGKWARCVEACALGPDLDLLPAGRETEIGEKGVNLSGGQKQRLSLARAMYQEADIYLLDDPLSAVDVHVGGHIFSNMIRGALGKAAVLLVTNAVQYLPNADNIVVLDGGQVVAQGTYQQCMEEPLFRSLLEEFRSEQQQEQSQGQGDEGQQQQQQQRDAQQDGRQEVCSNQQQGLQQKRHDDGASTDALHRSENGNSSLSPLGPLLPADDRSSGRCAATASEDAGANDNMASAACEERQGEGSCVAAAAAAAVTEAPAGSSRCPANQQPAAAGPSGAAGAQSPSPDAVAAHDSSGHAQHPYPSSSSSLSSPPYNPTLRQLPSLLHGVSTSAYEARRKSVKLARRQQQLLHGRPGSAADGYHVADLDEGNEMLDSLMRMSGDGAGGDGSSSDEEDGGRGGNGGPAGVRGGGGA
ncbi:hypothetical protein PLESTF_001955200, partial [Pleodorina starrii]